MIQRLLGVMWEPEAAFTQIAREERFLAAWLLAVLFFAAPILVLVHRAGPMQLFGAAVKLVQNAPELAEEPPEVLADSLALLFRFFAFAVPIVAIPLTAICLLPLAGNAKVRPLLAVTSYATLAPAIGLCLTGMIVIATRDPSRITFESLAPLNLGAIVRGPAVLHNIASTLEVFSAWSVYLLAHGVAAAGGLPFRKVFLSLALPLIFAAWLLAALIAVL